MNTITLKLIEPVFWSEIGNQEYDHNAHGNIFYMPHKKEDIRKYLSDLFIKQYYLKAVDTLDDKIQVYIKFRFLANVGDVRVGKYVDISPNIFLPAKEYFRFVWLLQKYFEKLVLDNEASGIDYLQIEVWTENDTEVLDSHRNEHFIDCLIFTKELAKNEIKERQEANKKKYSQHF